MAFYRYGFVAFTLLSAAVFLRPAVGQPENGPRSMVPIPEKPALSLEELQKATGGPTLVTYSGKDVALPDVVKFFQQVSGRIGEISNLNLDPKVPTKISVDWKDVPFWDAAREVEKLTGMRWTSNRRIGLTLAPAYSADGPDLNGLLIAETPFVRIYGGSVWHTKVSSASLSAAPAPVAPGDLTRLNLTIYYDPKLELAGGTRAIDVRVAGATMADRMVNGALGGIQDLLNGVSITGANGELISSLVVTLPTGYASGTVLPSVTAKTRVGVIANSKTWKVDDLLDAADAQESFEGSQFTVASAKVEGGQLKLNLEVEGDAQAGAVNNGPTIFNFRNQFIDNGIPQAARVVGGNVAVNVVGGAVNRIGPIIGEMRGDFSMGRGSGAFGGVKVRDAKGRELSAASTRIGVKNAGLNRRATTNELTFDLGTGGTTGPFSLEWKLPSATRNLDVPFDLKNLQVP